MVLVRRLAQEDAPAVADALAAVRERGAELGAPNWTREGVASELSVGGGMGAFIEDGLRPRTMAAFLLFRDAGVEREIMYLGTVPEFRRRGVMSKVLAAFFEDSEGKEIWLEVHRRNSPALSLYKRHGFQEVGRRFRYYADGDDAVLMARPGRPATL